MNTLIFYIVLIVSMIGSITCDFHLLGGTCSDEGGDFSDGLYDYYVACPSDYYNCDCIMNGDRAGHPLTGETINDSAFSITGMCGVGQMNFYLNSDSTYSVYLNGGDGSVIGTCYSSDWSIVNC